jgi:hypothetical protein
LFWGLQCWFVSSRAQALGFPVPFLLDISFPLVLPVISHFSCDSFGHPSAPVLLASPHPVLRSLLTRGAGPAERVRFLLLFLCRRA